jgi:hypothetical protein
MGHLTPDQLVDLAEGVRSQSSAPHLQSCERCTAKLAELQATLSAAASVDVPEPSPLFWDHFSARVHDAVESEAATGGAAVGRWSWLRVSPLRVGTVAVVALALALAMRAGRPEAPVSAPASSTATLAEPLGSALPSGALPGGALTMTDDPSLSFVADLAADLDWDAASEAGLTTHVGVDNDAVADLTDSERQVLDQLLKGELARRGA